MKKLPCLTSPTASNPAFPSKSWLWQTPLSFRSATTSSLQVTVIENITVIESRERRIRDSWQAKEKLAVNVHTACVSSPDVLYETRVSALSINNGQPCKHYIYHQLLCRKGDWAANSQVFGQHTQGWTRPPPLETMSYYCPCWTPVAEGSRSSHPPRHPGTIPACSLNAVWRRGGVVRAGVPTLSAWSPSDGKITRKRPSRALYLSPVKLQEVI